MLALFGNLDFTEIIVIAAVALMIFGRRLPEMAVRVASQVVKIRRSVAQVWRDAGIEEEIRKVKRNIELDVPRIDSPAAMTRKMISDIERQIDEPAVEPAGEGQRAAGSASELIELTEADDVFEPRKAVLADEQTDFEAQPAPSPPPQAGAEERSAGEAGAKLDPPGDRESA